MPVSATLMRSSAVAGILERQPHRARLGELMALPSRLNRICCRRSGSPITRSGTSARDIGGEPEALGHRLRRQRLGRALDQLDGRELDVLEVEAAGLDLGEVEDVVDDAQQRRRRIAHGAERLALLDRERRCAPARRSCPERRSSACGSRGSPWQGRSTWPGWRFSASRWASMAMSRARRAPRRRRPAGGGRDPPSGRRARCCRTASDGRRAHRP